MPLYDYKCTSCGWREERQARLAERNEQTCSKCGFPLEIVLAPVRGKMAGTVTPGGGPDRFTADMLGIPLKELPASLKADRPIVT